MWLISIAVAACDASSHDVMFRCVGDELAPPCPAGQPCPEVPLGSGGCDNLPGLFGHPMTPTEVGRPVGCDVGLPYQNPYFGSQQHCVCSAQASSVLLDGGIGAGPGWVCPI